MAEAAKREHASDTAVGKFTGIMRREVGEASVGLSVSCAKTEKEGRLTDSASQLFRSTVFHNQPKPPECDCSADHGAAWSRGGTNMATENTEVSLTRSAIVAFQKTSGHALPFYGGQQPEAL